jgi:hypothetical protein
LPWHLLTTVVFAFEKKKDKQASLVYKQHGHKTNAIFSITLVILPF